VFGLAVAALTGCATTRVVPNFEQSNQVFIEKTVSGLDVAGVVNSVVPAGSSVCLVSLETPSTYDHPVIATIEDAVIKSLRDHGFVVLERDDDVLRRMVSEGPDGTYRFVFLPSDRLTASASGVGASGPTSPLVAKPIELMYQIGRAAWSRETGGDRDTTLILRTPFAAAEYMVCYRVLECGLVHREGSSADLKKREGAARLHIRVLDANSSRILYAGDVRATLEDEIDADFAKDLSDFHYSFFSADYPIIQGTSGETMELRGKDEGANAMGLKILAGVAGVVLFSLILAATGTE
jgi:hypothetical protein